VRPEIHGSSGFYQYDTIDGKDWVHINITVTIELGASAIDVLCSTFREIIAQPVPPRAEYVFSAVCGR
jgi:hypothetical protein